MPGDDRDMRPSIEKGMFESTVSRGSSHSISTNWIHEFDRLGIVTLTQIDVHMLTGEIAKIVNRHTSSPMRQSIGTKWQMNFVRHLFVFIFVSIFFCFSMKLPNTFVYCIQ